MINDTTLKQIAAVKAMVNKREPHLATLLELALSARRLWSEIHHQLCHVGRAGRRNTTERLLAIDEGRLLPVRTIDRPAESGLTT